MKQNCALKMAAALVAGGILASIGSGCAWSIGGSRKGEAVSRPTRGQELMDLKRARDDGAISESEYQAQKRRVLEK